MNDLDPYESEQYAKFVESMASSCRCTPDFHRPCDGVLAGGLCDNIHWEDESHYDYEDDEE